MGQRNRIIKNSTMINESDLPFNVQLLNPNSWYSKLVNNWINELLLEKTIHEKINVELLRKIIQADAQARNDIMLAQAQYEDVSEARVAESLAVSAQETHKAAVSENSTAAALTVALMSETLSDTRANTIALIHTPNAELARMSPQQLETHRQTILGNIQNMMDLQLNLTLGEPSPDGNGRVLRLDNGVTIPMPTFTPSMPVSLETLLRIIPSLSDAAQEHPEQAAKVFATNQLVVTPIINRFGQIQEQLDEIGVYLNPMKIIRALDQGLSSILKIPAEFGEEALGHLAAIFGHQLKHLHTHTPSLGKPPAMFGVSDEDSSLDKDAEDQLSHIRRRGKNQ